MRHLLTLGALCALILPLTPVIASDDIDKDEQIGIGTIPADPKSADTPIDVVKPPTILRGDTYTVILQSDPPTIQVAEPFALNIQMFDAAQEQPLILEPGTTASLALLQRRGNCGLLVPIQLDASGQVLATQHLTVPYSGGYEAYLRFEPLGGEPVREHYTFFIEGVAENGKDITAMPRYDGPWATMPAFTTEVNSTIRGTGSADATTEAAADRRLVDYHIGDELAEGALLIDDLLADRTTPLLLISTAHAGLLPGTPTSAN